MQDQKYRQIYPEMLLSDEDFEKLINKRLLEFQLNPQKCDEEWDEMLKREQMLGDMDLVLKDNPLLSTQSICKGVDFINNSELNLLEQKSQIQILHSINEES